MADPTSHGRGAHHIFWESDYWVECHHNKFSSSFTLIQKATNINTSISLPPAFPAILNHDAAALNLFLAMKHFRFWDSKRVHIQMGAPTRGEPIPQEL